jgi:hypothetical protein
MELRARIRPFARRAAMTAALGVLLVPVAAGSATAAKHKAKKKYPTITSVRPMTVSVGQTLEIRGKNFRRGKNKNTVVFKRDGARAVFVKAPVGTSKLLRLTVPSKLAEFFAIKAGAPTATRFRLRVLASRLGKKFTTTKLSPIVSPEPPKPAAPAVAAADGDCDGDGLKNRVDSDDDNDLLDDGTERSLSLDPCNPDTDGDGVPDRFEFDCDRNGVLNRDQADDDSDLLSDTVETSIATDPCRADTDADSVPDGYEFQSARDLNDDEYEDPNSYLPAPYKKPYPNPLNADQNDDHDGDTLTLSDEFRLWRVYGNTSTLSGLVYSAGEKYSLSARDGAGHRRPTQSVTNYAKHQDFMNWAGGLAQYAGLRRYDPVTLQVSDAFAWHVASNQASYRLLNINRRNGVEDDPNVYNDDVAQDRDRYRFSETYYFDLDNDKFVSDDERDEDADGLTNFDEAHGRMTSEYWAGCYDEEVPYSITYAGTDLTDADTDGDGVRDGADDQDHDDIPNVMELSRNAASGWVDWGFNLCALDTAKLVDSALDEDDMPDDAPALLHSNTYGRVNPFNPCLPMIRSRTCGPPEFGAAYAPFDGSPNWMSLQ